MRNPKRRNLHTVKQQIASFAPEKWAGQQMGPSAPAFYKKEICDPVTGTRPTTTTFQRAAGTWIADSLIGQWAFVYDSAVANARRDNGVWYRITDNTADTITVSETISDASVDTVEVSMYNPISETLAHGESSTGAYSGCCYDGRYLWMAPRYANYILKLDTLTKDWVKIPHFQGSQAFEGCVFDGQSVWMVPREGDNWLKVDKDDHTITQWAHGLGSNVFSGAVFDGNHIWFAPRQAPLVRMDPCTMETTEYDLPGAPSNYKTVGANFDGKHVWIVPDGGTPYIYKIDPANPSEMVTIPKPAADNGFSNSIFDGVWLWLVPFLTTDTPLVRIHVTTNKLESIDIEESVTFHHHDGCFDGESLWLTPYNSADFIKVNPHTGEFTKFPHGQGESAFAGCLFDGRSIWWVPYKGVNIVRQFPPRYGTSRPWDQDTITEVDASSAGTTTVTMPRDTVRVTDSDGAGGSDIVLQLNDKSRPRRIVVANDSGNAIDISRNPDSVASAVTLNDGNAMVLYWSNRSSGLYNWGALT